MPDPLLPSLLDTAADWLRAHPWASPVLAVLLVVVLLAWRVAVHRDIRGARDDVTMGALLLVETGRVRLHRIDPRTGESIEGGDDPWRIERPNGAAVHIPESHAAELDRLERSRLIEWHLDRGDIRIDLTGGGRAELSDRLRDEGRPPLLTRAAHRVAHLTRSES